VSSSLSNQQASIAPPEVFNASPSPVLVGEGQREGAVNLNGAQISPASAPEALAAPAASAPEAPAEPAAPAPVAPRDPFKFDISEEHIARGRNLHLSANAAQDRNPNLVPFMIRGCRVALMPNSGGKLSSQIIEANVRAGVAVYEKIKNGEFDGLPSFQNPPAVGEDEICSLMWYLQALAASKAAISVGKGLEEAMEFKTGGMLIDDPDGKLKRFLDLANSYGRNSNHFTQYQRELGCQPRGVDVFNVEMPNEAKSVLYQKLPDDKPRQGAKLLYIKLEPFGQRGLSAQQTGFSASSIIAGCPARQSSFLGILKRFFQNLGHTLSRIFSRDPSRAVIREGVHNLEIVPNSVVKNYYDLVSEFEDLIGHRDEFRPILDDLNSAQGESSPNAVWKIVEAIEKARSTLYMLRHKSIQLLHNLYRHPLVALAYFGDHSRLRFGCEVILTQEEMGPFDFQLLPKSNQEAAVIVDQALSQDEIDSNTPNFNVCLNYSGERQERLIEAANEDFNSQAHLRILDASSDQGSGAVIVYDSPRIETAYESGQSAPEPNDGSVPSVQANASQEIDEALRNFGGDQQFSNLVRSVTNRVALRQLSFIGNYYLSTQSGQIVNERDFSSAADYTLTRITPRPGPDEEEPLEVVYRLEAVLNQTPGPEEGGGEPSFQGSFSPSLSVELTYYTNNGEMTARTIDGRVSYNLTRASV
jgi:hypothetical protein